MATNPKDAKQAAKAKPGKNEPADEQEEDAAPPKKKKSLLKMLIVIGLAALLTGGGAAWYFSGREQPEDDKAPAGKAAAAKAGKAAKAGPTKPPVFVPLEPFTVNLQQEDAGGTQYLQVGLTLQITDQSYTDAIKQSMPAIRNRILLLLSSKKVSQIATPDGKQALSAEVKSETAQALAGRVPTDGISDVLYTSFVIQ